MNRLMRTVFMCVTMLTAIAVMTVMFLAVLAYGFPANHALEARAELEAEGYRVEVMNTAREAIANLVDASYDVIILAMLFAVSRHDCRRRSVRLTRSGMTTAPGWSKTDRTIRPWR